jgi:hypothetical protein
MVIWEQREKRGEGRCVQEAEEGKLLKQKTNNTTQHHTTAAAE